MAENDPPPGRDVHDALNEPATDPDPTEWPDPYDKRPDPRDPAAERSSVPDLTGGPGPMTGDGDAPEACV